MVTGPSMVKLISLVSPCVVLSEMSVDGTSKRMSIWPHIISIHCTRPKDALIPFLLLGVKQDG